MQDEHSEMLELSCVLPFDTDCAEFARGFEAGRIWQALRSDPGPLEELIHAANTEMVMRMAEACQRGAVGEQLDALWTRVVLTPSAGAEER
jgi:hypothetical protein